MRQSERETALRLLSDLSAERRLEGARLLQIVGESSDESALRHALAAETVGWVQLALTEAIAHLDVITDEAEDSLSQDADWNSVAAVTNEVVHELSHVVARMRLALDEPSAQIRLTIGQECDRLASFLEALKILHIATIEYKSETFDLAALLLNVSETNSREFGANIDLIGLSPCLVVGSRVLVEVIVQNALRNAVEANIGASRPLAPIVVGWGRSPRESWLSILDAGIGPLRQVAKLFRMGATTKPAHAGMGLSICAHAARRLGGVATLQPGSSGGARFELRWPSI